jgi:hypothetical protein
MRLEKYCLLSNHGRRTGRKSFQRVFDKHVVREACQRTAQSSEKVRNTLYCGTPRFQRRRCRVDSSDSPVSSLLLRSRLSVSDSPDWMPDYRLWTEVFMQTRNARQTQSFQQGRVTEESGLWSRITRRNQFLTLSLAPFSDILVGRTIRPKLNAPSP